MRKHHENRNTPDNNPNGGKKTKQQQPKKNLSDEKRKQTRSKFLASCNWLRGWLHTYLPYPKVNTINKLCLHSNLANQPV